MAKKGINIHKRKDGRWEGRYKKGRNYDGSLQYGYVFATRCIEVGVDIKSLSEMLGHSDVSITLETYVHSSMQLKRTQLEKLSSISA